MQTEEEQGDTVGRMIRNTVYRDFFYCWFEIWYSFFFTLQLDKYSISFLTFNSLCIPLCCDFTLRCLSQSDGGKILTQLSFLYIYFYVLNHVLVVFSQACLHTLLCLLIFKAGINVKNNAIENCWERLRNNKNFVKKWFQDKQKSKTEENTVMHITR